MTATVTVAADLDRPVVYLACPSELPSGWLEGAMN
jgi:hypothetical protein